MTLRRLTDDPTKPRLGAMLRKAREESLSADAERRIAAVVLAPTAVVPPAPPSGPRGVLIKGALGLSALAVVAAFALSTVTSDGHRAVPSHTDMVSPREGEGAHASAEPVQAHEVGLSVHDFPAVTPTTRKLPDAPPVASAKPESTPTASSHGHRTTAAAAAPVDSLGEEAALLRSVREDLSASRTQQALRKLDQYDDRFGSHGAMREEAAVTRVEGLLQAGRTSEANTSWARAFSSSARTVPSHASSDRSSRHLPLRHRQANALRSSDRVGRAIQTSALEHSSVRR